jgi:hypothetical protein
MWRDRYLWSILVLAAILLFSSLGSRNLWQDEAETALLAKRILRTGLPTASDGKNVVSQEMGRDYDSNYLWRWSPWMQFYLTAGSFAVFAPSEPPSIAGSGWTIAARLPFVLLGLVTIPLTYLLARRFLESVVVARLSAFFLTLSVPFLLHARQCRWYAPAYVLVCCLFLCFIAMAKGSRWAIAGFVLSAALLFYTNFFVAIGLLAVLLLSAPLYKWDRPFLVKFGSAYLLLLPLVLPGYFFFAPFHEEGGKFEAERIVKHINFYAGYLFTFLLPMPIVAVLGYWLAKKSPADSLKPDGKRSVVLLLAISFLYSAYLTLAPWHMFRYLTIILPFVSILIGLAVYVLFEKSRLMGWVTLGVLVVTDAIHIVPLHLIEVAERSRIENDPTLDAVTTVRGTMSGYGHLFAVGPITSPIASYLYEIMTTPHDPEPVICKYLNEHAKPTDVVLATYDDLPIQFYTGLKVVGNLQGQPIPPAPDWIVPRQNQLGGWIGGRDGALLPPIRQLLKTEQYDPISLSGPDFFLGNCPEPGVHRFKPPGERGRNRSKSPSDEEVPSILIVHRKGSPIRDAAHLESP